MLEILVGPIASGKSTYSKERAREGAVIVNDDSIVNALHGGYNTLYDKELKPLYKSIENLIVTGAIAANRDVVIDRPNYKQATRMRYTSLAKSLDIRTKAVIFPDAGKAIHVARRMRESRGYSESYWKGVYDKHAELFEEVDVIVENFDEYEELWYK